MNEIEKGLIVLFFLFLMMGLTYQNEIFYKQEQVKFNKAVDSGFTCYSYAYGDKAIDKGIYCERYSYGGE